MNILTLCFLGGTIIAMPCTHLQAKEERPNALFAKDFEKVGGAKILEYLPALTTARGLCNHDVHPDIRFWSEMMDHYDFEAESNIRAFFTRSWTVSIERERSRFQRFVETDPNDYKELCNQAGQVSFPESYSFDGFIRFLKQLNSLPRLLPR